MPDGKRHDGADRVEPRSVGGRLRDPGREDQQPAGEADRKTMTGAGVVATVLRVQVRAGVGERGEDDRQRAGDRPPAALGSRPTSTATPPRPTRMPTSRDPLARSLGRIRIASRATKIGTVVFAIAATPETT